MMKKVCLLLAAWLCMACMLTGCVDEEGTKELNQEFIGKTFVGHKTTSTDSGPYAINGYYTYTFTFIDEDTVSYTNLYKTRYGSAYNKPDTQKETVSEIPYAVKKTSSGKAYVFIKGFGSDGKDTSDNDDGLEIVFDASGEIDYFIYDSFGGEQVRMQAQN